MTANKAGAGAAYRSAISPPDKIVSIVDRAASLLECFGAETGSLGLVDLAARLALPKPTIFRLATVMARLELLERSQETGAYSLGLASMRYAGALLAGLEIRAMARPAMEALRAAINETVVLSLRDGDFRYNIDNVESTHAIGQTQLIGAAVPLYAGAASRVLLAALPDQEFEDYVGRVKLKAYSEKTITDVDALRKETVRARKLGYVTTAGEYTVGSHAIARPIKAPIRHGLAALYLSIPPARYTKALERKALNGLNDAIEMIAEAAFPAA